MGVYFCCPSLLPLDHLAGMLKTWRAECASFRPALLQHRGPVMWVGFSLHDLLHGLLSQVFQLFFFFIATADSIIFLAVCWVTVLLGCLLMVFAQCSERVLCGDRVARLAVTLCHWPLVLAKSLDEK